MDRTTTKRKEGIFCVVGGESGMLETATISINKL